VLTFGLALKAASLSLVAACVTFRQKFLLDINTSQGNHTFLGAKGSSSFVDSGKQFQVTYGSGAVAGNIITDNVNIAGLALDKQCVFSPST
jgi:hypothetical protein